MSAGAKAVAFAAGLAVVFGAAFGIGALVSDEDGAEPGEYALVLIGAPTQAGTTELRFAIEDADGARVTDFEVRHEKRLHLIAVDTGYTGYQHLHPTMAADGTWSTPFDAAPGFTQIYADFRPRGTEDAVARADIEVPGAAGSPAFSTERTVRVAGYDVRVDGDLASGTSALKFEVSRDGVPVTDLEPYLGAYGHLVMLRKADGEYLHVHPEDGAAGPEIAFLAEVPSAARYHLYLDFKHAGTVHTAMFVLDATEGDGETDHAGEHGSEHGSDHGSASEEEVDHGDH